MIIDKATGNDVIFLNSIAPTKNVYQLFPQQSQRKYWLYIIVVVFYEKA